MNWRIVTHPAALAALALIGGIIGAVMSSRQKPASAVSRLFEAHPHWACGLRPMGYGALAAFLFNDSGIVAAFFLLGVFLMTGLYFLFSRPAAASDSALCGPTERHGPGALDTADIPATDTCG
jgi:hypothetical protein